LARDDVLMDRIDGWIDGWKEENGDEYREEGLTSTLEGLAVLSWVMEFVDRFNQRYPGFFASDMEGYGQGFTAGCFIRRSWKGVTGVSCRAFLPKFNGIAYNAFTHFIFHHACDVDGCFLMFREP
jgi:hypothetical protein